MDTIQEVKDFLVKYRDTAIASDKEADVQVVESLISKVDDVLVGVYRVYYNKIEEFYVDIRAKNREDAKQLFDEGSFEGSEETGSVYNKIVKIEDMRGDVENLL